MKPSPLKQRLVDTLLVILANVVLDQWTKQLAIEHLRGRASTSYLGDTFRLLYAENRGAFLSLGATLPEEQRTAVFSVVVGLFLVGMLVYTLTGKTLTRLQVLAMALLVGGGLSNWWDRVARGGVVVDFMNMGIGPVRTGIFNVADISIMAGAFMMLFMTQLEKRFGTPVVDTPPPRDAQA